MFGKNRLGQIQVAEVKTTTAEEVAAVKTTTSEEVAEVKTTTAEEVAAVKTTTAEEVAAVKTTTAEEVAAVKTTTAEEVAAVKTTTAEEVVAVKTITAEEVAAVKTTTSEEVAAVKTTTSEEVAAVKTITAEVVGGEVQEATVKITSEEASGVHGVKHGGDEKGNILLEGRGSEHTAVQVSVLEEKVKSLSEQLAAEREEKLLKTREVESLKETCKFACVCVSVLVV